MPAIREEIFVYSKFNIDALLDLCHSLRGRLCTCDRSERPKAGSLNWVVFVTFDDGVEWVFRSPRCGELAIHGDESASKLVVSEASTLKYLRANTSIPVPQVYSYSGTWENTIGVPYILMSKAEGRTLAEYDWVPISTPGYKMRWPLLPVPEGAREKVMSQVGTMMSQLSDLRFKSIGSIFEDGDGDYSVGECLSPSFIWQSRDLLEGINRGPFSEESQYLDSLLSMFTAHAKELPLTTHGFFAPLPITSDYPDFGSFGAAVDRWNDFVGIDAKLEESKNRHSYCIASELLREMMPRISTGDDSFTLSHPDMNAGNLFVDDDLNVTCIIDWGSASVGPVTELLSTPGLGSSTLPLPGPLIAAFRAGFSQRPVQPHYWEKADMMWHLSRLVRLLSRQDYTLFSALYEIVHKVPGADIPRLFADRAAQEHNRQLLAELEEDDFPKEEIEEAERATFGLAKGEIAKGVKAEEIAVARKLTVMSQINQTFLADHRLWRWIQACHEQSESE